MQKKEREIDFGNELQFELKYCERCGGLWLRPVGGEQIYCVACGQEIAQLPLPSREPDDVEDSVEESFEEYVRLEVDAWGGVA
jgi:Zn-finger nucleic acid-binding protein